MAIIDLNKRLRLFRIDADTRSNLARFQPVLDRNLDEVIEGFYKFIRAVPEARAILNSDEQIRHLQARQKAHWNMLFSGPWDETYRDAAVAIGIAHFHARVPPFLYIAAYTYFQAELTTIAVENFSGSEAVHLVASIGKIISLDMELALSSYLRAVWTAP